MQPAVTTKTIADLVPGVQAILQGRTDLGNGPLYWIKRSIQNFTESEPFEELRVNTEPPLGPLISVGPQLGLNGTSHIYPIQNFLNTGDDYTMMEDPVIFLDPPANTISYAMDYENYKAIVTLLHVPGSVPFKYTRWGTNFFFGGSPSSTYAVYCPYQRRHPFNDQNLGASPIYIPPTWEEIVEYDAARRGAIERRWPDMAAYLQKVIFGDPKDQSQPGLLKALKYQQDRDQSKSVRQLMPQVGKY